MGVCSPYLVCGRLFSILFGMWEVGLHIWHVGGWSPYLACGRLVSIFGVLYQYLYEHVMCVWLVVLMYIVHCNNIASHVSVSVVG